MKEEGRMEVEVSKLVRLTSGSMSVENGANQRCSR